MESAAEPLTETVIELLVREAMRNFATDLAAAMGTATQPEHPAET